MYSQMCLEAPKHSQALVVVILKLLMTLTCEIHAIPILATVHVTTKT